MTSSAPQLAVVISAEAEAVRSLLAPRGQDLELILVRPTSDAGADASADSAVEAFPIGAAYERNRGLELATAPAVAFLGPDARPGSDWLAAALDAAEREAVTVGPSVGAVFPREALVDVGGFDLSVEGAVGAEWDAILRVSRRGVAQHRDSRLVIESGHRAFSGARSLARVARRHRSLSVARRALALGLPATAGLVAGGLTRAASTAPLAALELMPEPIRSALGSRGVRPLPLRRKAKTKLMYAVGEDALLHVYLNPSAQLRAALENRDLIRRRAGVDGIPAVIAVADGFDSCWSLEQRLPGVTPTGVPNEWFDRVAGWAVEMAGPVGPLLGEIPAWQEHREDLVTAAPDSLRAAIADSAHKLGSFPSVHMHGDFQRANILVAPEGVGAVDWEGVWLHGIPGLDVIFLAVTARGTGDLDARAVIDPVMNGESAWARLKPVLERLGIGSDLVAPVMLVGLASWSAAEQRRLRRLGSPPGAPVFRRLLEDIGPLVAGQASTSARRTPG